MTETEKRECVDKDELFESLFSEYDLEHADELDEIDQNIFNSFKAFDGINFSAELDGLRKKLFKAGLEEGIKHEQKKHRWIPVKDKPEYKHQKFVSVKLDNDIVQPALFHPEFVDTEFSYEGHTLIGVIEWQPLPKA